MKNSEIKQQCDEIYSQIKELKERLKEIRNNCPHLDTFKGNYSWRIGVIEEVDMCEYCGSVINKIK